MSDLNTMGHAYGGGSMFPLAFDTEGLPWMRTENFVTHIDKNKKMQVFSKKANYWQMAKNGDLADEVSLWPFGGKGNFAVGEKGVFLLGAYQNNIEGPFFEPDPVLVYLDFSTNKVIRVMGGNGRERSQDSTRAGDVSQKSISSSCTNSRCSTYFDQKNDILYFSELNTIRAIKNPTNEKKAFLSTLDLPELTTTAKGSYKSFILSADGKKIFVIIDGNLKCYNLKGSPGICNGQVLGPTDGLGKIGHSANQMTWKSPNELLISTLKGTILSFKFE